jgi:hypothetical protein
MKVWGIDLKGNDAIICLMTLDGGLYSLPDCRVKKLSIADASDAEQVRKFQFDFEKLMQDYQIEHAVIRERMTKGKFAGGAVSFKLEAAIQLSDGVSTSLMAPSQAKEIMKRSHVHMDFQDTGLKQFQELAFMTALAYLER